MSHIVTIETQVRDPVAIQAACQRLQLSSPREGQAEFFSGEVVTGWLVLLPEWRYPLVCQTAAGALRYDNYGGQWGSEEHLHAFLQAYAVEKAKLEARKQGHSVVEQTLPNGAIQLTVQVGS